MKLWTDTEYVDAYQRYMSVPGTVVGLDEVQQAMVEIERQNVENLKLIDEEHAKDLAEKDREIAKWRRIRTPTHGNCCTCQRCGLDHDSCRCDLDDVCDELDQLKKAYRQLMEKAVRFAQYIFTTNNIYTQNPVYKEAQSVLKEHL